ncbi:hypothetical protein DX914_13575 [Lysobacter silvisoli]|uniref:Cytochrome c domain-containing protein n=2 Tax=Lysobacter silvisoli TaxID=2293254 RepID=A0A371K024_9GAMM|nr:hypothetical protein DX914_13575 [Lysobacter silvisoli]
MIDGRTSLSPQHALRVLCMLALLLALAACERAPPRKLVIVGGPHREGAGRHDYPAGVRALQRLIETSPDTRDAFAVVAYPDGWPQNPAAFDDAAVVIWYFDGLDRHPLCDPARRAAFAAAMRRGTGLIALHQASTVPPSDDLGLTPWLGGVRVGMYDRSTQWAQLQPRAAHPATQGLSPFGYRDEFYPSFRYATGGTRTALLSADLHPQFRDGRALLEDRAERTDLAWAYEREGGGRSVVFSGAHYLESLHQAGVARLLLNAALWTADAPVPEAGAALPALPAPAAMPPAPTATVARATVARATFHVDSERSGWRSDERVLAPDNVDERGFGLVWESPPLDAVDGQPPRLYASPLYIDRLTLGDGPQRGQTFAVVIAASSNGYVYAINAARQGDLAPGRILWRRRLSEPCRLQPAPLDGVPTGVLSTPIADVARGRLYVTHCDAQQRWQAYALDLSSGAVQPGWPVRLDEDTFNTLNANQGPSRVPPTRRYDFRVQRGALNLSPDGRQLYVVFGETETGWLVSVDTDRARVRSAFAAVAMPHRGSGGIWGAGGPAVDREGQVYVVTGSGFEGYRDAPHDWTQSVLKLAPPAAGGFVLRGTYTPFNHCSSAKMDIDLGSGGIALLRAPAQAGAPRLLALGGKQGNAYLLDRDRLPGRLDRRPPCSQDAASDGSLLPPTAQPQFGTRGPLNVFGPYSEQDAALDLARSRSVPATFRDAQGHDYLYLSGSTKRAPGSADSVAPSLVRLQVERPAGGAPYLRIDRRADRVMKNPGSPVVTSRGADRAIVWVLDENAPRSAQLSGTGAPQPVLYAFDAATLKELWRSAPGELHTSGKYNEPAFGGGQVYVGTDRIQAFGLGGRRTAARPVAAPAPVDASPVAASPLSPSLSPAALYAQRCAACHDHPQGNIPPRAVLATRPKDRIVEALSRGVMRPQAAGLDERQVRALADYLRQ